MTVYLAARNVADRYLADILVSVCQDDERRMIAASRKGIENPET